MKKIGMPKMSIKPTPHPAVGAPKMSFKESAPRAPKMMAAPKALSFGGKSGKVGRPKRYI